MDLRLDLGSKRSNLGFARSNPGSLRPNLRSERLNLIYENMMNFTTKLKHEEYNNICHIIPNIYQILIKFYLEVLHGEQAQVGESKSLGFQNYPSITFHLLQCCKKLPDIVYKPKLRSLTQIL